MKENHLGPNTTSNGTVNHQPASTHHQPARNTTQQPAQPPRKRKMRKCLSDEVLGIARIWKFARRARRYMNCYEVIGEKRRADPGEAPEDTWDFIERLQKDMKNHRCPMEQDGKWIRACTGSVTRIAPAAPS